MGIYDLNFYSRNLKHRNSHNNQGMLTSFTGLLVTNNPPNS